MGGSLIWTYKYYPPLHLDFPFPSSPHAHMASRSSQETNDLVKPVDWIHVYVFLEKKMVNIYSYKMLILKLWSPDRQHQQHHLSTCWKCKFSNSLQTCWIRNLGKVGGALCLLKSASSTGIPRRYYELSSFCWWRVLTPNFKNTISVNCKKCNKRKYACISNNHSSLRNTDLEHSSQAGLLIQIIVGAL